MGGSVLHQLILAILWDFYKPAGSFYVEHNFCSASYDFNVGCDFPPTSLPVSLVWNSSIMESGWKPYQQILRPNKSSRLN